MKNNTTETRAREQQTSLSCMTLKNTLDSLTISDRCNHTQTYSTLSVTEMRIASDLHKRGKNPVCFWSGDPKFGAFFRVRVRVHENA
jgi:hypothetical protein